ncbi:MAG: hypothetical protein HOI66_03065, partial [Verrucomicrobia bacterium]|nr:hypothetical protein [Verrucomicrobiota bacterium]
MSSSKKPQPRRRRWLKWTMRLALVGCLAVVGLLLYLNQIGLPEFAKSLLQQELRANGLNLEFERLRWRLERGLVAEGIQLEVTSTNSQPSLIAEELKIRFNRQSLLTGTPKIASVLLSNGQLGLPLVDEETLDSLNFDISDLQTKLSFPSPDLWILENFNAVCLGIRFELQAEITNAFALKSWRLKPKQTDGPPKWPKVLQQVIRTRNEIDFTGTPALEIKLHADAAHPERSSANISLSCNAMESPWGSIKNFSLQVSAEEPDDPTALEFDSSWTLSIGMLTKESSQLRNLQFSGNLVHESQSGQVKSATWTLNTGQAEHAPFGAGSIQILGNTKKQAPESQWFQSAMEMVLTEAAFPDGSIERIRLSSELTHQDLNWRQADGNWTASIEKAQTKWASVTQSSLNGTIRPNQPSHEGSETQLGPWKAIQDFALSFTLSTKDISGETFEAESLEIVADWKSPSLQFNKLSGTLYDGAVDLRGSLEVDTRKVELSGNFDFDVHRINHLLTPKGQRWLSSYQFEKPPAVQVKASVTLPKWDDPDPDWRGQVKPSMSLAGNFNVGKAAFRNVPVQAASSSILFTNMTWRLPDLHVIRPEGEIFLNYRCDANTQDYHWKIKTLVNYDALYPLLSAGQTKGLKLFEFDQPVRTDGDIWGRWHSPELTRLKAQIATTNFTFRGVPIKSLQTELGYVNGLVTAQKIAVDREEGSLRAELALFNSRTRMITVTNALSTADTAAIAKMIGPKIEQSFQDYHFSKPPTITLNGIIPIDGFSPADARFHIKGGPFAFWRFNVPEIEANVDWIGQSILIDGVDAPFYDGTLRGDMTLKLNRGQGTDFSLDATVRESDLNKLFTDVISPESKSQGTLGGHIKIESGKTDDWDSWQGTGQVKLREGHLWDTPLFGIFSPLLNTVSPGLGNSRAGTGDARFRITDSVIHTTDLVVQEPTT